MKGIYLSAVTKKFSNDLGQEFVIVSSSTSHCTTS